MVLLNNIRGCSGRVPTLAFLAVGVPALFTSRTKAIASSWTFVRDLAAHSCDSGQLSKTQGRTVVNAHLGHLLGRPAGDLLQGSKYPLELALDDYNP